MGIETALFAASTAISAGSAIAGGISSNKAAKEEAAMRERLAQIEAETLRRNAALESAEMLENARMEALLLRRNAKREDGELLGQAKIVRQEARREAIRTREEIEYFRGEQAMTYNKSGVTLEGSPLLVLEETRRKGQEEIDAILGRGQAISDLYVKRGRNIQESAKESAEVLMKSTKNRVNTILRSTENEAQARLAGAAGAARVTRNQGRAALVGGLGQGIGTLASAGIRANQLGMFGSGSSLNPSMFEPGGRIIV